MRNVLLFLAIVYSGFTFSSERVFLLHDADESDHVLQRDFKYFNRLKIYSPILEEYFNLGFSQKNELLTWSKDLGLVILGSKFNYSICFNHVIKGTRLIPCNDNHNAKIASAKNIVKIKLLDGDFSLFFPKETLDKAGIDGGFVLDNGRRIVFENHSPAIVVERKLETSSIRLDEESISLYRVAHVLGLMKIKESFYKKDSTWTKCMGIDGKEIWCDLNTKGAFAFTGALLSVFSDACFSCEPNSRLMLKYYAANYLLRVPGNNEIQQLGVKNYMEVKRKLSDQYPIEMTELNFIYRWALSTELSAQ